MKVEPNWISKKSQTAPIPPKNVYKPAKEQNNMYDKWQVQASKFKEISLYLWNVNCAYS